MEGPLQRLSVWAVLMRWSNPNAHNAGPASQRKPGTYDGPLGRSIARRTETLTVLACELQPGDRVVEFDEYLVVRAVDRSGGRVEVWFDTEASFDLPADLGVEVRRTKR